MHRVVASRDLDERITPGEFAHMLVSGPAGSSRSNVGTGPAAACREAVTRGSARVVIPTASG